MLKNIPEKSKNKKIIGHIVHGIFEKYVDAQKYQHMMVKEFPMMVVDKVGEMNVVHLDLNIMKDDLGNYKIIDFDRCELIGER